MTFAAQLAVIAAQLAVFAALLAVFAAQLAGRGIPAGSGDANLARHRGFPDAMTQLIEELGKLPGVGSRTAERLASHLLLLGRAEAMALAYAIRNVKRDLQPCSTCWNFTEGAVCAICQDTERNPRSICVVEESRDLAALEEAGVHEGLYHVLGGRLAPLEGRDGSALTLEPLALRVTALLAAGPGPVEVILATNPNLEGEGTALKVRDRLAVLPGAERCEVTRIATGMPAGSAIEYVHKEVLADAYLGRRRWEPAAAGAASGHAPGRKAPARRRVPSASPGVAGPSESSSSGSSNQN